MKAFLFLLFLMLLGACGSKEIYYWGNYEDTVYASFQGSSKVSPNKQIEVLRADYTKSREVGRSVPPGFHAHLGMLYYKVGNPQLAKKNFNLEKKKFPESAKLMNRFLRKL